MSFTGSTKIFFWYRECRTCFFSSQVSGELCWQCLARVDIVSLVNVSYQNECFWVKNTKKCRLRRKILDFGSVRGEGAQWANLGLQAVELNQSIFCYRTPDFVNGPFVALDDIFDLAPSDWFLNFSFPSYGRFREGDPPTQQKVLPHLTVRALTDSNSPSALRALALRARALRARAGLMVN